MSAILSYISIQILLHFIESIYYPQIITQLTNIIRQVCHVTSRQSSSAAKQYVPTAIEQIKQKQVQNSKYTVQRRFKNKKIHYETMRIRSAQGYQLSVIVFRKDFVRLPTVLYLHGNGGNKLECLQLVSEDVNLVAFDFAGCGKSQGEFVTYGEKEAQDIADVVDYIRKYSQISNLKVALWGRSMGASLALLYASAHSQNVHTIILDSPFRSLKKVISNIALKQSYIPYFLLDLGIGLLNRKIKQICSVDIFQYDFLDHLNLINQISILFAYSQRDCVVLPQDVEQLYEGYQGPKSLYQFSSLHHEDRPQEFISLGCAFITKNYNNSNQTTSQYWNQKLSVSTASKRKGISLSTRRNVRKY